MTDFNTNNIYKAILSYKRKGRIGKKQVKGCCGQLKEGIPIMGLSIYNILADVASDNPHLFPTQLTKGRICYGGRYTRSVHTANVLTVYAPNLQGDICFFYVERFTSIIAIYVLF